MRVEYNCTCGYEGAVDVPTRHRAVDVTLWMNRVVMTRLFKHHATNVPQCSGGHFNFSIPLGNDEYIGQGKDEKK